MGPFVPQPQTKLIGGFDNRKPTSVRRLDAVKKALIEQGPDKALEVLEEEIRSAWVVEGFWSNVRLEPVYDK